MKIHIENYRNIDQLDYELIDGKINYLFGVCGSGKSSIVDALSSDVSDIDVSVGKERAQTVVRVDGKDERLSKVRVYNSSEQETIFKKGETTGSYDVFIGSENELEKLEADFNEAISSLKLFSEKIYAYQGKIQELQTTLGKPGKGGFTRAAKVSKASAVAKSTTPFLKNVIEDGGLEYANWIATGMTVTSSFKNGECPFCGALISADNSKKYSVLDELKVSDLKPLFSSTTLLDEFDITLKKLGSESGELEVKERLIQLFKISEELKSVLRYCNAPKTSLLEDGVPDLRVDECVYIEFPDLKAPIEAVSQKSSEIKTLLGQMKSTFNGIIRKNCNHLNTQLKRLSIPYRFRVSSATRDSKTVEYVLSHNKSTDNLDMRDCLSTGEKNLVALLLFLANRAGEVLLIDDPASSFDDYRRTQIFDLLQDVKEKTVLVVSHDQAFAKRALLKEEKCNNIGKVQILCRRADQIGVFDIDKDDIVFLPDEIRNHFNMAKTYWRKVINLRLLCDLKKDAIGEAWGYSSMLLHKYDKMTILEKLEKKGISEEEALSIIKKQLQLELSPIPDDYPMIDESESLTDFEKLIARRETIDISKSSHAKIDLQMLNDLVHMNDAAAYCLNPYKHSVWSPDLNNLIG